MTKDEYLADQEYRKDNPALYPWFAYFLFGFHSMRYLSDDELKEHISFYRFSQIGSNWVRMGNQPITICPRQ